MSNLVIILGPTGSGKSTSIKNLNPKDTVILALKSINKDLPFKGSRSMYNEENKNYFALDNYNAILQYLDFCNSAPHVHNIVIEDATYIMRTEFFDRIMDKTYDKFTDIADHFRKIIAKGTSLRKDINVFLFLHSEPVTQSGDIIGYKMATIGKLLDNQYNALESVTVTLFAQPKFDEDGNAQFGFWTKKRLLNGVELPCKSPDGMFEEEFIPNDLNFVIKAMNEYYG
jgi:energy-coupling factor transporter ATP-binding protein EcfA2